MIAQFGNKGRTNVDFTRYLLSDVTLQVVGSKSPSSSQKHDYFSFIELQIISVLALLQSLFNWLLNGLRKWPMQRTLAPLRRIVARSMEVIQADQMSLFETEFTKTTPFAVIDRMACGHETTSLLWDFRDLVNGYSVSPWVKARHHRCHECAKAIARNERKQPQSVKWLVAIGVA